MNIPEAAIEAAEEAIAQAWSESARPTAHAIAVLEAALPHIREVLAREIEARLLVRVEHLSVGRVDGLQEAATLVRGGTV